jgi:hypothetical protein
MLIQNAYLSLWHWHKRRYYVVNVAGSTNLDGITDWQIGDWAIYNGSVWQKVDNTDSVSSVNGQVGTVVLDAADVNAAASNVYVVAGGLDGTGNLEANVTMFLANTKYRLTAMAVPTRLQPLQWISKADLRRLVTQRPLQRLKCLALARLPRKTLTMSTLAAV